MVNAAISLGALVGVVLSAGFVYWQVGRYAAPQVEASRFDERREMIAYTVGLFAGIPLVVPLLFLFHAIPLFELGGIALYLALLVGGAELAQYLVLRSAYFGRDGSGPFYALGLRAGIGGLLVVGIVTEFFSAARIDLGAVPGLLAVSTGIVAVEAVSAVLALPGRADRPGRSTGPLSAVPLEAVGFLVLGISETSGDIASLLGGAAIAAACGWLYRTVAPPNLDRIAPPVPAGGRPPASAFGRTDRGTPPGERPGAR